MEIFKTSFQVIAEKLLAYFFVDTVYGFCFSNPTLSCSKAIFNDLW